MTPTVVAIPAPDLVCHENKDDATQLNDTQAVMQSTNGPSPDRGKAPMWSPPPHPLRKRAREIEEEESIIRLNERREELLWVIYPWKRW